MTITADFARGYSQRRDRCAFFERCYDQGVDFAHFDRYPTLQEEYEGLELSDDPGMVECLGGLVYVLFHMDVAERTLVALEKVGEEYPTL